MIRFHTAVVREQRHWLVLGQPYSQRRQLCFHNHSNHAQGQYEGVSFKRSGLHSKSLQGIGTEKAKGTCVSCVNAQSIHVCTYVRS